MNSDRIVRLYNVVSILPEIEDIRILYAAIQKKQNTTQIDITQTKAFKETQRVEKQIQKKLEQFYDEILAKVPAKTIDQLKMEYTPKIRQVVRAAIQTVYVSGTNYATKTTDLPAFVTQKDVENIRKHTDSLVAAFWRRLTVAADVKAQNEFFPALPSPKNVGLESGQLSSHITEAEPVTTPDSDSVLLPAVITSALTMTLTQGLLSKLQQTRNLEEVKRKVIWVSERDAKVCPICQALDGQDWDEDDPSVPIPGPDSSHYNCRCRILVKDADGDILEDI